ncbi:MFS transporter [Actinophytocola sp.]|uniref:MFS transporter n=1 Tax=Actinophytocola sp. TaxID=1872138 RepID=UPI003D6B1C28
MAISTYSFPALAVLSGLIIDDLDIGRSEYGLAVSTAAASTAGFAVLAGKVVDRFSGRGVLLGVFGLTAASAVLLAVASSFAMLLLALVFAGTANGANNPATNKVISENVPTGRRGTVVGAKQSGVQAGILVIGLVLPSLALATSWRWSLVAVTVAALSGLVVACRVLPRSPTRSNVTRGRGLRAPLPAMVRWLVGYSLLMGAGGAAVTTFLPLYAHESLGFNVATAGAAAAAIGLLGMVARILASRTVERMRHVALPLLVISVGATVSVLALLAAQNGRAWLWIGVLIAGATIATWNAITMLAAISASATHTGRATGWVVLGFMGGYSISPVLFGTVLEDTGSYTAGWLLVAALFSAATAMMFVWGRVSRSVNHNS